MYIDIYTLNTVYVRVFYYNLVLSIQSNDLMSRPTVWHKVTLLNNNINMLWVFHFINPYEPSYKGVSITISYTSRRSPHRNRMFYYTCILKQTFCCPLIFTAAGIKDSTSCVIGSFCSILRCTDLSHICRLENKQEFVCVCLFLSGLIMTGTRVSKSQRHHIFSRIMLIDVMLTFRSAAHRTVWVMTRYTSQMSRSVCFSVQVLHLFSGNIRYLC